MATWDFISKRRRIRLAKFVEGANTLEEALAIFHRKKVSPPTDGTLEALFETAVAEEQQEEPEEQPVVELVQDETVESEDVPELTAKKQTGFSNSKKGNSKKKKKYASKKTSTTNESESENDV
jgi:hypothetical protein